MILALLKRLLFWIHTIYELQIGTELRIQLPWSLVENTRGQIQLKWSCDLCSSVAEWFCFHRSTTFTWTLILTSLPTGEETSENIGNSNLFFWCPTFFSISFSSCIMFISTVILPHPPYPSKFDTFNMWNVFLLSSTSIWAMRLFSFLSDIFGTICLICIFPAQHISDFIEKNLKPIFGWWNYLKGE